MSDSQAQLREAIDNAKAGNKEAAKQIVTELLKANRNDINAWIVMAQLSDDPVRAADCWRQVLKLRPGDERASKFLAKLEEQLNPALSVDPFFMETPSVPISSQKAIQEPEKTNGSRTILIGAVALVALLAILVVFGAILVWSGKLQRPNSQVASEPTKLATIAVGIPELTSEAKSPATLLPATSKESMITNAPRPTDLPQPTRPTDTPLPTTQPTNTLPQIGTRSKPIPVGEAYNFPGYGPMTVVETKWSPNTTGVAIVSITFSCQRPVDQKCDLFDFMFGAVGASGTSYESEFSSSVPEPNFGSLMTSDLYGGGTTTGYYGFLITGPETSLGMTVQIFLSGDEPVFFDITKR